MDSLKKAALHLHCLDSVDRQWVLGQLPTVQQKKLRPLLAELRQLGIPPDQSLLHSMIKGTEVQSRHASGVSGGDESVSPSSINVGDVPISTIYELLNNEPDAVIAAILFENDCPWKSTLLKSFEPSRQERIAHAMASPDAEITHHCRRVLLNALEERIHRHSVCNMENLVVPSEPTKLVKRWSFFRKRSWR